MRQMRRRRGVQRARQKQRFFLRDTINKLVTARVGQRSSGSVSALWIWRGAHQFVPADFEHVGKLATRARTVRTNRLATCWRLVAAGSCVATVDVFAVPRTLAFRILFSIPHTHRTLLHDGAVLLQASSVAGRHALSVLTAL